MKMIKYWAPWCAPCKSYSPIVEYVADEQELELESVNVEATPVEGIMSIPVVRLVDDDGTVVAEKLGALSTDALRAWVVAHKG